MLLPVTVENEVRDGLTTVRQCQGYGKVTLTYEDGSGYVVSSSPVRYHHKPVGRLRPLDSTVINQLLRAINEHLQHVDRQKAQPPPFAINLHPDKVQLRSEFELIWNV